MTEATQSVLFVDDEPHILNAMKWLFKKKYKVLIANSGDMAIELLKQNKIDVIVSDQKMPGMTGVEVLHQAKEISPGSMRILLTGYSDFEATVGSVNKGEIFRFIQKPWVNQELKDVVKLAAETYIHTAEEITKTPAAKTETSSKARPNENSTVSEVSVLVLDSETESGKQIQDSLGARYRVLVTNSMEKALELLEKEPIGVIVSETRVGKSDVTAFVKLLKQYHPDIVSLVMTNVQDAQTVIGLINQGQIFRFLTKPVKAGICRLSVEAAVRKHITLKNNPALVKRHIVDIKGLAEHITGTPEKTPTSKNQSVNKKPAESGGFFGSMINRLKGMRLNHG